jgi:hypothetical protein
VCDALKRCGNFKRLSSSPCSRTNEGISARLPRDSAYTGIRFIVRSESWRLTSARHVRWEGGDQRHQRFQSRCDDGQRSYPLRCPNKVAVLAYLAVPPDPRACSVWRVFEASLQWIPSTLCERPTRAKGENQDATRCPGCGAQKTNRGLAKCRKPTVFFRFVPGVRPVSFPFQSRCPFGRIPLLYGE